MAKEKKPITGKIYYVDAVSGDNRHDGLDQGGYIIDKAGMLRRNIHPLRTIQKAMDKIGKYSQKNTE